MAAYQKRLIVELDENRKDMVSSTHKKKDTVTNWENLGNAIIVQAVNDYRRGLAKTKSYIIHHTKLELPKGVDETSDEFKEVYRKHELSYAKDHCSRNHDIIMIEKFFHSDFFRDITNFNVDPLYILNGVRREMNIPSIPQ